MSGFKDVMKGGWHPKGKDSGKESWRGESKGIGQVAGWLGKGRDTSSTDAAHSHQSAPLSSLKDPTSFGPPPKRWTSTPDSPVATRASENVGLGAAISPTVRADDLAKQSRYNTAQQEQEQAEAVAPQPYQVNTTGLSTQGLPLPPRRRDAVPPTSTMNPAGGITPLSPASTSGGPPRLPPRLPPRQNSRPDLHTPAPPPNYQQSVNQTTATDAVLNQASLDRLGRAGVSVPGLGINAKPAATTPPLPSRSGSSTPNWNDVPEDMLSASRSGGTSRSPRTASPANNGRASQLSELQSRFSKLRTGSDNEKPAGTGSDASNQGTTWAQKQAAFATAQNFHKDPRSVSLADAADAAKTARNFHERHGEQAAAGLKTAQGLQQRFAIGATNADAASPPTSPAKKAPPPPPPKKPELHAGAVAPPVPLSSKPR